MWLEKGDGKTFRAPESFLGFCGTCDWGQGGGKTFQAPESFLGFCGTCDCGHGGGKTFRAPESFLGFCGTCDWGQGGEWWKNFLGTWKFSRLLWDLWLGAGWWNPWKFSRLLWDLWLGAGWWKNFLGTWKFSRLLWDLWLGAGWWKRLHSWTESQETPVGTKTFPVHKRNNRSSKLFQSSKVFFQDGVANSVISTSLIRGYQPRHLGWGRYSLPRTISVSTCQFSVTFCGWLSGCFRGNQWVPTGESGGHQNTSSMNEFYFATFTNQLCMWNIAMLGFHVVSFWGVYSATASAPGKFRTTSEIKKPSASAKKLLRTRPCDIIDIPFGPR